MSFDASVEEWTEGERIVFGWLGKNIGVEGRISMCLMATLPDLAKQIDDAIEQSSGIATESKKDTR